MATKKRASDKDLFAVIHITRKECWGENREPYEQMLAKFYGAGSSSELSYREKLDFIDRLKAVANGDPQPPMDRKNGPWANKWAIKKIDALTDVLGWETDQRLNGFIKRQTNKNKTKWMITKREATKVIIGLQKMVAGGNRTLYNWLNTANAELINSSWGRQHIQELK
jgi:hypothetical protein